MLLALMLTFEPLGDGADVMLMVIMGRFTWSFGTGLVCPLAVRLGI